MKLDEPPVWPKHDKDFERVRKMLDTSLGEYPTSITSKMKEPSQRVYHETCPIRPKSEIDLKSSLSADQLLYLSTPHRDPNYSNDISVNHEPYRLTNCSPNGYSKELTTLLKFYGDKSKYSGKVDVFDYKL